MKEEQNLLFWLSSHIRCAPLCFAPALLTGFAVPLTLARNKAWSTELLRNPSHFLFSLSSDYTFVLAAWVFVLPYIFHIFIFQWVSNFLIYIWNFLTSVTISDNSLILSQCLLIGWVSQPHSNSTNMSTCLLYAKDVFLDRLDRFSALILMWVGGD